MKIYEHWNYLRWLVVGLFVLGTIIKASDLAAYEDDPRIEEHNKLTDRLLAFGNAQAEALERERMAFLLDDGGEDAEEDEI